LREPDRGRRDEERLSRSEHGSSEPKQPPGGKMRLPSHETRFDLNASLLPARYRDNAF